MKLNVKRSLAWLLALVLAMPLMLAGCGADQTEVSEALDACIVSAIREEYCSDYTAGKYPAVAYTVLGVKEKRDTVTVYGVMMYREYTCTTQNELKTWGTAHAPFAITATAADGTYDLVECWWPEEGDGYEKSVKKKFPKKLREKVINFQRYYGPNDAACKADAEANIAAEDKYTVLQSERENVWLAYQEQGGHCYVVATASTTGMSTGGYSATGTYTVDNGLQTFTFGTCKMALEINGNHRLYNTEFSQSVPTSWESYGEIVYLDKGTRFSPVVRGTTALVGDTLTVSGGMNWMEEDEIRKLFGYVPGNFGTAADGEPRFLPVKVLTSRAQLDLVLANYMQSEVWPDLRQETFTQFDETFFERNSLVMTYYNDGTYEAQPSVTSYIYTEEGTCLSVRLSVDVPEAADAAVGQWLLFSGVAKSDMTGITVLEAYVENTTTTTNALTFTGKVKQVEGNAMLMETDDVAQFSSGVWVELGDAELVPMGGETYTVTYEDIVMPSLPPRITAVTITKP